LKINLINRAIAIEIKIQNPMKFSEKISRKKPPKRALKIPPFFEGLSKRLIRITAIKMRPNPACHPKSALKWIKKLV